VRVIACLTSLPNIIHSDYQGETISSAEGKAIRKFTGATTDDTLVLVWGDERDVTTASKEIEIRAKEATIGVPSETRQALYDGTNGFERILPGADRMYPDTDLPPKSISEERVQRIKATIPTQFWKLENWYNELGVPKDVIKPLAVSKYARLFEILVNEWKIDPVFASVALIQYPKKLKKKRFNIEKLTPEIMEKVFLAYRDKIIIRDAVILMMEQACPVGEFSDDMLIRHSTEIDIIENILKVHYQLDKIKLYNQNNRSKLLFGLSMKNLRGKAHHEDVRQYIDKIKNGVVK
jgi:glutamyl-tRNA(Gln) amidotransferase subunit E